MGAKIRVLMVDDEPQFRSSTANLLNRKGFDTTMAGSGREALDIMKETPPDVVILDIKMPGMDGHETLTKIREIQPDVRVIMLTGHGTSISAKDSLAGGAFDYLNKPCDIDLLVAKINDAFTAARKGEKIAEKRAGDIMIRVADYTTITADSTVAAAVLKLMRSFESFAASGQLMETGHRSILVFDNHDKLVGILSILNLIEAVRPAYLSAPKPSMADSMQYSPMFWSGLFSTQVREMAAKKVGDIMSESPPSVSEDTNLMELADLMFSQRLRRLVVVRAGEVVGVVREQELFFEMVRIIKH